MPSKLPRIIVGSMFIIAGLWWIAATRPPRVSVEIREITVDDLVRRFRLVKPASTDRKDKMPLLIALPGAQDSVEQIAEYSQLDKLCAREKFTLVYLEGRKYNWPPSIPEEAPDVYEPDIAFFDAVCDQMVNEGVNSERIYLVGVSQGGCMANVLAIKRSERLAAVVVNCGWMPKPLDTVPPKTEHKCPILTIVGSEDTQVGQEAVRLCYELFQMAGHPVRHEVLPGAGHGWNAAYGVNELIWSFLRDKENKRSLPNE